MIGTAGDIALQIRRGQRSAAEVLRESCALIEASDARLNCFTQRTFERAQREAGRIDALRAQGVELPPLAGVPYAVKNLFDIEEVVTLAGAKLNAANPPARRDAVLVSRMQAAGALLLGAVNMDEHAYGFTCENSHYGPTRNPHDTDRVSGGSSGGSAAAVGAGLVPLSLGSDTSGSIRVPASLCGVFGLKPTYGRLPRSGTFPFVDSLDHVGPLAGTSADLALAYDVLQGGDPADPACAPRAKEATSSRLTLAPQARIGVLEGWFHAWAGPAARRSVELAAAALGADAHCEWRSAEAARAAAFIITGAEGGALHGGKLQALYQEFEPASRDRLVAGSLIPSAWVIAAQRVRRQAYEEILKLFEHFDVLLAPATPVCAPLIGAQNLDINGRHVPARASLGLLTQPISCVGLPACVAPLWPGLDAAALPIGVQLIGAPWREDLCLAAGAALEAAGVASAKTPTGAGGAG